MVARDIGDTDGISGDTPQAARIRPYKGYRLPHGCKYPKASLREGGVMPAGRDGGSPRNPKKATTPTIRTLPHPTKSGAPSRRGPHISFFVGAFCERPAISVTWTIFRAIRRKRRESPLREIIVIRRGVPWPPAISVKRVIFRQFGLSFTPDLSPFAPKISRFCPRNGGFFRS